MARVFADGGAQALATVAQQNTCLTSFSVAFWMKRTATPAAARALIAATIAAVPQAGWYLQLTTGNLILAGYAMVTADKQRTSATAPALNGWTHVLVTHNQTGTASTDFVFYFNGKSEAGTNTSAGSGAHDSTTATKLEVGSGNVGLAPPANIGPVAIWSRALSPAEALALATGEHPLRFKEGLVEIFDMATATGEEGWLTKLYLVQGATNPTSADVSPPLLAPPGSQPGETHLNVRPTVRSRARYFVPAAGGFTPLSRRTLHPFGNHVGGRGMRVA